MTVKELKKTVEEFEDEDIVIMRQRREGNGFSPLSDTELIIMLQIVRGQVKFTKRVREDYHTDKESFEEIKRRQKVYYACLRIEPLNKNHFTRMNEVCIMQRGQKCG